MAWGAPYKGHAACTNGAGRTNLRGSHRVVVRTKGRVCIGPTDTGVLLCAVISRTVAGHLRRMGTMAATHDGEIGEASA